MRRTAILTTLLLLSILTATAQTAIGSWRSHAAYHNATQCASVGDKVYVVSDGSLYSYSPDDEFVECYDKTNSLSDQGIRHIAVDEQTNTLIVIYDNANIDLIAPDGEVTNITDYASKVTLDPTVNDIRMIGSNAYIATNFGLTVLNVARAEFANTYMLGEVTNSCLAYDGYIYAATTAGLYRGDMADNLLDTGNWKLLSKAVYARLMVFDNALVALGSDRSVYRINTTEGTASLLRKGPIYFAHST